MGGSAAMLGATAVSPVVGRRTAPMPEARLVQAKTRDGLVLSGAVFGSAGPEILLVHGLGQSRLVWDRQIGELAASFRVAAFDLRGHGDSSKPDEASRYGDAALWGDDIRAMIRAAGMDRPTLVGWSLGGLAVGHYLKRNGGDRIAGVLLASPISKMAPELLTPAAIALGEPATSADLATRVRSVEDTIALSFAQPVPEASLRRMLVAGGMPPRALFQGYGGMAGDTIDDALAGVDRLHVVYGARDAIARPEMSRRIVELNRRATLSIYPTSGHAPFHDDPVRFNSELAAFASGREREWLPQPRR